MQKKLLALLLAAFLFLTGCALPEPAVIEPTAAPASAPVETADGDFSILFLDVGQADSMLVRCGGAAMLVDGGNVDDSSVIHTVLAREGVEHLDYMVCTHAHEDHCGGLPAALELCDVDVLYAPVTEYDTKCFRNVVKYAANQNLSITVPEPDTVFSLGDAEVTILGPRKEYEDTNDTSIVLRVVYGDTSFLLTGDMESDAEADLLDAGCELSADLLKVGHHGSSSSTSYPFLREVMPTYAVICVGEDNSYGHPHDETVSKLQDAGVQMWRTDRCGDILCVSDGTSITLTAAKDTPQAVTADPEPAYIGNTASRKFHLPSCSGLPQEQNRIFFYSRQEAVEAGYEPCGNCRP